MKIDKKLIPKFDRLLMHIILFYNISVFRLYFRWRYVYGMDAMYVCACLQTSSLVLIISFIVLYIKLNFFLSFIIGILSDFIYLLYIFHLQIFALNENNFSNIASIWWPNFFFAFIPSVYKLVLYMT